MTIAEARDKLQVCVDEIRADGWRVWGWDDESIVIGGEQDGEYCEVVVEPEVEA